MNIFGRGDGIRLTRKQRFTITAALRLASEQWLNEAAKAKTDGGANADNRTMASLDLAGEARALAILLEPEAEEKTDES